MHDVKRSFGVALLASMLCSAPAYACWEEASARYNINPYLLYAIAKTESGLNPSAVNRNKNGSYDIGMMQINSLWLPELRKHGLEEKHLYDPCTSIHVGAWILAQNMRRMGNSWEAVGAYNAGKPDLRLKYALKVYRNIPPAVLAQRDQHGREADSEKGSMAAAASVPKRNGQSTSSADTSSR